MGSLPIWGFVSCLVEGAEQDQAGLEGCAGSSTASSAIRLVSSPHGRCGKKDFSPSPPRRLIPAISIPWAINWKKPMSFSSQPTTSQLQKSPSPLGRQCQWRLAVETRSGLCTRETFRLEFGSQQAHWDHFFWLSEM